MILDVALDADPEWDSSIGWADLAEAAAEAAIAESRFPLLAAGPRCVELSIRLAEDEEVHALNAAMARQGQADQCPLLSACGRSRACSNRRRRT